MSAQSSSQWWIRCDGKNLGPLTANDLRQQAVAGVIGPDTPVRQGAEGNPWVRAAQVRGLFPDQPGPDRSGPAPPARPPGPRKVAGPQKVTDAAGAMPDANADRGADSIAKRSSPQRTSRPLKGMVGIARGTLGLSLATLVAPGLHFTMNQGWRTPGVPLEAAVIGCACLVLSVMLEVWVIRQYARASDKRGRGYTVAAVIITVITLVFWLLALLSWGVHAFVNSAHIQTPVFEKDWVGD